MDQQPGPDLLMDQLGQPRAQDLPRAAEVGLELVVAGLLLSGSPGALLRRGPLRTVLAALTLLPFLGALRFVVGVQKEVPSRPRPPRR
jgi:hypothetical protein